MLEADTQVFVDGHVHVYRQYDPEQVMDGAWRHFNAAANLLETADNFQGVLVLTESANDDFFPRLYQGSTSGLKRWQIAHTDESTALILSRDDGAQLLLLAGRQAVSAEGLEVSAYFVSQALADGAPLDTLLEQVNRLRGVAVLPWGVGKWLGKRGKIVEQQLVHCSSQLLVSDNGGRPWFWLAPALFGLAERQGVAILAGTDPLPRASEQERVGSYGFMLQGALSLATPSRDLRARLLSLRQSPTRYGKGEAAWRFFRNQLSMRLQRFDSGY